MDSEYEILRRGNDVLAVSVDGFVCYGTHEPRDMDCHRAIEFHEPTVLAAPNHLEIRPQHPQVADQPREISRYHAIGGES